MKLVIFGATGGLAKQLVKQALEGQNDVVAYVRDPSKLNFTDEHLSIIRGELTDLALIENSIKCADAVISALGPRGGSKSKSITRGIQTIIGAMQNTGVSRLIISSTASVTDPNDMPDRKVQSLVSFVKRMMYDAYEEIISVAEIVRKSDLDWTIVRLIMLNNKPGSGIIKACFLGKGEVGLRISRADVAKFMLDIVQDGRYMHEAPVISN